MTLQETVAALESLGTAQNRKVYARHGAGNNVYGVSFANLGMLKKKIKTDHALARGLWSTGNFDARVLATMVADAGRTTAAELDDWVKHVDGYPLADAVARFVEKSPLAMEKMEQWMKSKHEFTAQMGWQIFSLLAMRAGALSDEYARNRLAYVEARIQGAQNRVRHSMNSAVIAIGSRSVELREAALAAAARIGKVTVDHGETDCKTPDAAAYIRKMAARGRPLR